MRLLLFTPNPIKTSSSLYFLNSLRSNLTKRTLPTRRSFIPARMAIPPRSIASAPSCTTTSGRSNVNIEEGLASKFWIKFRRESVFAMYTPFVISLASGTLKIDSFRHYISQDSHFLKSFAHAFELAEECADDDEAKLAISELRKGVLEELKMHNSFVQEWGIDPGKEGTINSATVKYTDFLLATASGKVEGVKGLGKLATPFERTKVAAYTLGAMTPCMRLYSFLGKELQAVLDLEEDGHPYKKWIDSYSSESFQASALQTEDLLDKLSVSLTGEELDIIEKLYHQAMKLEIEFFLAQPIAQTTLAPLTKGHNPEEDRLVIFSDFDLTCTVVDSSAILAEIAILTAPKSDVVQPETPIARMSSADLRNTWGLLSGQYTEEYEQCIESIMPSAKGTIFLCKFL
ncbi:bifunctional TH2 protein [Populus alba x Populus x berolinensis]|nr:bifunctional TH2 protein [Populus alba x Populus x berolinensis]